VALPETIPVKYSEEEAEYLSLRPVMRQTFRMRELVDMILAVTGKNVERVRQVLSSGTTVYHFYRYWWQSFEVGADDLARLLAEFPDAQPDRAFQMQECVAVHLEIAPGRTGLRLEKQQAARRRLVRRQSSWDCIAALAQQNPPRYSHYAYDQRADCFVATLAPEQWLLARRDMLRYAQRRFTPALLALPLVSRALYYCPR
jgi:hypothetical protein